MRNAVARLAESPLQSLLLAAQEVLVNVPANLPSHVLPSIHGRTEVNANHDSRIAVLVGRLRERTEGTDLNIRI